MASSSLSVARRHDAASSDRSGPTGGSSRAGSLADLTRRLGRAVRTPGTAGSARGSTVGGVLVVTSVAIVLATAPGLHLGHALWPVIAVELVAGAVGICLAVALRRVGSPSAVLLVFPVLLGASVLVDAFLVRAAGAAYTGFLTLAFIYLGLTQRRWTSVFAIPIAAVSWWYCQIGAADLLRVRLVISCAIWLIVAEVIAAGSERHRHYVAALTDEARTDHLTGLGNRRRLDLALDRLATGAAVVVIDLDHFKEVNDRRGHAAGDLLLIEFADRLQALLGPDDQAFRFGGEEMVVICNATDDASASAVALLDSLRAAWAGLERPTFSAGVSVHAGGSAAETLARADLLLYEAKRAGRARVCVDGGEAAGARGQPLGRSGAVRRPR